MNPALEEIVRLLAKVAVEDLLAELADHDGRARRGLEGDQAGEQRATAEGSGR